VRHLHGGDVRAVIAHDPQAVRAQVPQALHQLLVPGANFIHLHFGFLDKYSPWAWSSISKKKKQLFSLKQMSL
jgi:hypothetical protein